MPSGPFTDQVIQFEFDVIPPGPGVPAVTYSMAVWSQSESVGCKDNVPANCAVSSYLLHPSLVAAGDPALAKTGAASWIAPAAAGAFALLAGAVLALASRGRQARRAR